MHAKIKQLKLFILQNWLLFILILTTNLIVSEINIFHLEYKSEHTNSIYISHN